MGGRGPTRDISPTRTFRNCGSSSKLERRKNFPNGVILLSLTSLYTPAPDLFVLTGSAASLISFLTYSSCTFESLFTYIERNLRKVNVLPNRPTRCCLKNTGPWDVNFIVNAINRNTGE